MHNQGDLVTCPMESTGGSKLEILMAGLTVEIDAAQRMPCYLARNVRTSKEYLLIVNIHGRLVGAQHRSIGQCREIETPDGELVAGDLKRRIDAALNG